MPQSAAPQKPGIDGSGRPAGATSLGQFDPYAGSYDDAVNASVAFSGLSVDFFTRAKAEHILELIGETGPAAVLDVGCGVGNYHGLLRGRAGSICGIDVSAASLETARARNPDVDYRAYDGVDIPYPDASFDFAYAVCVYHHVPPPMRARLTADVRRVLKPGGRFAIFEHNPRNPLTRRAVNNCPFDADAVLLRRAESEALLRAAGFEGVAGRFILTIPARGGLLRRIDAALSPLGVGAQYYAVGRRP